MATPIPGFIVRGGKVVANRKAKDASAQARARGKPPKRWKRVRAGVKASRSPSGFEPGVR